MRGKVQNGIAAEPRTPIPIAAPGTAPRPPARTRSPHPGARTFLDARQLGLVDTDLGHAAAAAVRGGQAPR